jgi:hypothetical protein
MVNTYTWDCKTVDTYPTHNEQTDVIYNVHWRVNGSDGTYETTVIGTQVLSTEDLSNFTAFDSVTHANVIDWTKAALGAERVAEIEASLDATLAELATPTSVTRTIEE